MSLRYSADLFFFRQTTDLIVYVPLFSTDFTRFTVNPAVTGSRPCFSQKLFRAFVKADETEGSPLPIFFRHCAIFLPSKGPTFKFSDILQQTCQKAQRAPFKYFSTMTLFKILVFRFFFRKFPIFSSPKGPSIFLIFCRKMGFSKSPKGPL